MQIARSCPMSERADSHLWGAPWAMQLATMWGCCRQLAMRLWRPIRHPGWPPRTLQLTYHDGQLNSDPMVSSCRAWQHVSRGLPAPDSNRRDADRRCQRAGKAPTCANTERVKLNPASAAV
jgi:hypothetical protein